ncbi:hypothetical protein CDD80_466 [Ophiocordyceps camponoti-rufipedis]|uniref:Ribosomal RNA-processing protein 42 n=1 Tax=Ophiocordyceps camponoti-rufipedis TaxID=2004952 RepID=A0A2C5ZCQ3_9HYPO|nr:hypothetical protein CDD80_466 [Ophiocordyceps camponoti-rufipedis]
MAAEANLFSPAELAYLYKSLSQTPAIRPDGRTATQFRPLTAETGILPGCNGSARVCLSDGTEAIVGVKAELERTTTTTTTTADWLELTIEIPGQRDDEAATVFLAEMLREALVCDGDGGDKILLVSPPLSYPVPLLSTTSHLALLATRLPRLRSEGDEDPMFDDDWEASTFLYPRDQESPRPPITLLVMSASNNIILDPAREELIVADAILAVSVSEVRRSGPNDSSTTTTTKPDLRLVSVRSIDPPSRLTPPGVPNSASTTTANGVPVVDTQTQPFRLGPGDEGVWRPPVGGVKISVLEGMMQAVLEREGVAREVLDGLEGVELA